MKYRLIIALLVLPLFLIAQNERGRLAIGTQFYQNLMLPDNYEGFGVGLNWQLDVARGFGLDANYIYEALDLQNVGNIKRFQRGISINYVPFYKEKLSPWIQVGVSYNTLTVVPVSYLFSDNTEQIIEQDYFGLNLGLGGQYKINKNLTVNSGFYFQPQNYTPNYFLSTSDNGSELQTNIKSSGLTVKPILYFNFGFTYQIAKLW